MRVTTYGVLFFKRRCRLWCSTGGERVVELIFTCKRFAELFIDESLNWMKLTTSYFWKVTFEYHIEKDASLKDVAVIYFPF